MQDCDIATVAGTLIGGVSTFALAAIAWYGVRSWKHQVKAKIKTEFLDELVDSVNEYINKMGPLVHILGFIEIGIKAYRETEEGLPPIGDKDETKSAKQIAWEKYVNNYGNTNSQQLRKYLDQALPARSKVSALSAKGQVFKFGEYEKCLISCQALTQVHDQIYHFAVIFANTHMNWNNEEARQTLDLILENVTSENTKSILDRGSAEIIKFVQSEYSDILD